MTHSLVSCPVQSLKGTITVPGDKSISHRAVLFGAIAEGMTTITGCLNAEDCMATKAAFRSMGVTIADASNDSLVIHGVGKYGLRAPKEPIQCGNSGTTMRLLAGLLAAQSFDSELIGDASLQKRPMRRISDPLTQMGADIATTQGCPPLRIRGGHPLHGLSYDMPISSAQVKSCIILAGLYAEGHTSVTEQLPTRDHTERMLKAFSYPVLLNGRTLTVNQKHVCRGTTIRVPGDISSAAFFIVAATLIPHADLWIRDVGINATRTGIIDILTHMGANIEIVNQRIWGEELVADLHIQHAPLRGIEIPATCVPSAIDEFPAIFIAASCAIGTTILHGAEELRHKESDRVAAMVDGLRTLGISACTKESTVSIEGGILQGGVIDSRHDHRIAMAFAIAGAKATSPVTIRQSENIKTSFPNFVEAANSIQLHIQELDHGH